MPNQIVHQVIKMNKSFLFIFLICSLWGNEHQNFNRLNTFETFHKLSETAMIDSIIISDPVVVYDFFCLSEINYDKKISYTIPVWNGSNQPLTNHIRTFKAPNQKPLLILAGEESGGPRISLILQVQQESTSENMIFRIGPEWDYSYAINRNNSVVLLLSTELSSAIQRRIAEVINDDDKNACVE